MKPGNLGTVAGMYCEKELITPKRASDLLANENNIRTTSPGWVRYFEGLIKAGQFVATPDGVCLSPDGVLINGKHRLTAVVNTGIAVWMFVWYNVPQEVVEAIDQGRKRRLSDVLRVDKRITEVLAFNIRVAYKTSLVPPGAVRALLDTEFGEAAARLINDCGGAAKHFSAVPIKTAAIVQMLHGDEAYVMATYADLVHARMNRLPPIAASFVGQTLRGVASAAAVDRYDALARALAVFDVSKRNLTKIQVGDNARTAALDLVRATVRQHLHYRMDATP